MENAEKAGYEAAKFAFDTQLKEMKDNIEKLATDMVCQLNFSVNPDQIISVINDSYGNPVSYRIGGTVANSVEMKNLKEEVRYYKNMRLYEIFHNTLRQKAQEMMFQRSTTYEDMKSGKMCLFNLEIMEKILKAVESFDKKIK